MATATAVPQTYELEGDDALRTLRSCGIGQLFADSFRRFRAADGFTHSRALAFQVVLTFLPALIAFVGFATLMEQQRFSDAIRRAVEEIAPGPSGQIITQAFQQGEQASGGTLALAVGLIATLASATFTMAQVERGANRIYGMQADRPTSARYWRAFVLACSAGLLLVAAFAVLLVSSTFVDTLRSDNETAKGLWDLLRWPVGIAFVVAGFALLFERAPRRRQPEVSWLAFGSVLSIVLWLLLTGALAVWLGASNGLGDTYGPLAGMIGMLLWAFLTGISFFLGLAFSAQLEAVRAGVSSPRTDAADAVTGEDIPAILRGKLPG